MTILPRTIKGKIFSIIIIFAIGLIAVLAITSYGMKMVSLVVPFLRGERVANAIPVRDAEIYFKEYLLTGNKESKERFFRAYMVAAGGGVYGKLIEETPDVSEIEAEINRRMLTPGYEKDALTPDEVATIIPLSFRFRGIKIFRRLLELAHTHGEKLEELLLAFKQLVQIKESPAENGVKEKRIRVAQIRLETLFKELNFLGAQFSEHTGKVAYSVVHLITFALLSVIIIFIAIGSVTGFLISRSVTIPLSELVDAVKIVAKGDLNYKVKVKANHEIGGLAASFNQMTSDLKKSKDKIEDYSRTLEQKVEERTKELKAAQAQLIQSAKMSAVGQLGAGVAHELNNPLGGVLGYAQFILEKLKKPDFSADDFKSCARYVESIERESARCKNIVANLLKFSRRPISVKPEPVDIAAAIKETLSIIGHQLQLNNVKVIEDIKPDLADVMGVVNQLQQIFTNLILNAQQAMPEGGELKIIAENIIDEKAKAPTQVRIEFIDTGCGIPEENLSRIFEPFFTTKQKEKGTGLGLSVVYEIIQKHKGTISVKSEAGKGTTFTILLPAIKPDR